MDAPDRPARGPKVPAEGCQGPGRNTTVHAWLEPMDDTTALLAAQPFLAGLTDRQLAPLAPLTTRAMFHAGNRVFREGTTAHWRAVAARPPAWGWS